jgi:hypothetical protein
LSNIVVVLDKLAYTRINLLPVRLCITLIAPLLLLYGCSTGASDEHDQFPVRCHRHGFRHRAKVTVATFDDLASAHLVPRLFQYLLILVASAQQFPPAIASRMTGSRQKPRTGEMRE